MFYNKKPQFFGKVLKKLLGGNTCIGLAEVVFDFAFFASVTWNSCFFAIGNPRKIRRTGVMYSAPPEGEKSKKALI